MPPPYLCIRGAAGQRGRSRLVTAGTDPTVREILPFFRFSMHAQGTSAADRPLFDTPRRAFRRGMVQSLPFLLVLGPFGVLFGVAAQGSGLDLLQTMGFSVLVLAGGVAIHRDRVAEPECARAAGNGLVTGGEPAHGNVFRVDGAVVCAAPAWQRGLIAYLLVDQNYALALSHAERYPALSIPQRVAFFMGAAAAMCPFWVLFTYLGATAGNLIPASFPLDFAIPITFLSMISPMLRTIAHVAAAVTAVIAALALAWMPSGSGMLVAAGLGMVAGALVETAMIARAVRHGG